MFLMTPDFETILNSIHATALNFKKGVKSLADRIDKPEKTLYAELERQGTAKLGLTTSILISEITGDLTPFDLIERRFGRVAFFMPVGNRETSLSTMRDLLARLMGLFGQYLQDYSNSISTGTLNKKEARTCLTDIENMLKTGMEIRAHLERMAGNADDN
jgi:hypothetical protein